METARPSEKTIGMLGDIQKHAGAWLESGDLAALRGLVHALDQCPEAELRSVIPAMMRCPPEDSRFTWSYLVLLSGITLNANEDYFRLPVHIPLTASVSRAVDPANLPDRMDVSGLVEACRSSGIDAAFADTPYLGPVVTSSIYRYFYSFRSALGRKDGLSSWDSKSNAPVATIGPGRPCLTFVSGYLQIPSNDPRINGLLRERASSFQLRSLMTRADMAVSAFLGDSTSVVGELVGTPSFHAHAAKEGLRAYCLTALSRALEAYADSIGLDVDELQLFNYSSREGKDQSLQAVVSVGRVGEEDPGEFTAQLLPGHSAQFTASLIGDEDIADHLIFVCGLYCE